MKKSKSKKRAPRKTAKRISKRPAAKKARKRTRKAAARKVVVVRTVESKGNKVATKKRSRKRRSYARKSSRKSFRSPKLKTGKVVDVVKNLAMIIAGAVASGVALRQIPGQPGIKAIAAAGLGAIGATMVPAKFANALLGVAVGGALGAIKQYAPASFAMAGDDMDYLEQISGDSMGLLEDNSLAGVEDSYIPAI